MNVALALRSRNLRVTIVDADDDTVLSSYTTSEELKECTEDDMMPDTETECQQMGIDLVLEAITQDMLTFSRAE